MTSERRYTTTTAPPTFVPAELTVLRQIRTLFEVFDKGLQAALAQSAAAPPTANDLAVALTAETPRRRSTDLPVSSALRARTPTRRVSRIPSVWYRAKDGRVKTPRNLSDRDQEVYQTIHAFHDGLSRKGLLERLHVGARTGIIDGAVRRLRLKKLIVAERVH